MVTDSTPESGDSTDTEQFVQQEDIKQELRLGNVDPLAESLNRHTFNNIYLTGEVWGKTVAVKAIIFDDETPMLVTFAGGTYKEQDNTYSCGVKNVTTFEHAHQLETTLLNLVSQYNLRQIKKFNHLERP